MHGRPRSDAWLVISDLQVSETTKVAVVQEFALLQRSAHRVADSYLVAVASVYRWKDCPELVERALRRTSVKVLRAELMAAEASLHWMGRGDSCSSVEPSDKAGILEALRVARFLERQALRFGAPPSVPGEVVYEFIRDRMSDVPAAAACRAFGVARSGYYAWCRRGSETRHSVDRRLRSAISGVVAELGEPASYRRISERLRLKGLVCSRHRVRRLIECPESPRCKNSSSQVVR